jgi:hypothetical protein
MAGMGAESPAIIALRVTRSGSRSEPNYTSHHHERHGRLLEQEIGGNLQASCQLLA